LESERITQLLYLGINPKQSELFLWFCLHNCSTLFSTISLVREWNTIKSGAVLMPLNFSSVLMKSYAMIFSISDLVDNFRGSIPEIFDVPIKITFGLPLSWRVVLFWILLCVTVWKGSLLFVSNCCFVFNNSSLFVSSADFSSVHEFSNV
jgi:hypothetical protein